MFWRERRRIVGHSKDPFSLRGIFIYGSRDIKSHLERQEMDRILNSVRLCNVCCLLQVANTTHIFAEIFAWGQISLSDADQAHMAADFQHQLLPRFLKVMKKEGYFFFFFFTSSKVPFANRLRGAVWGFWTANLDGSGWFCQCLGSGKGPYCVLVGCKHSECSCVSAAILMGVRRPCLAHSTPRLSGAARCYIVFPPWGLLDTSHA